MENGSYLEYLTKYSIKHEISEEEAEKHQMVKEAKKMYEDTSPSQEKQGL